MKFSFSPILTILLSFVYPFTATAQTSMNFNLTGASYEIKAVPVDDTHAKFAIGKSAAGAPAFTESLALLKTADAVSFAAQFDAVMVQIDAHYDPNGAAKVDIDKLKVSLFDWFSKGQRSAQQTQLDNITDKVNTLFAEKADARPIGEFILKSTKVQIKQLSNDNKVSDLADGSKTIKSVEMTLLNGSIAKRGLKVTLDDGSIYFNRSAPINLYNFFKRTDDRLWVDDKRHSYFIEVGDILDYSVFGRFVYPSDIDGIILSPSKVRDTIRVSSTINELLDVNVYTDLLGLLGKEPNGLLQTEVSGNFISNSSNSFHSDIVFHNFVKIYFRLAKFDSKFAQLDSSKVKFSGVAGKDTVNRAYLNQISFLGAGIKTNIVRFGIGTNQQVFFNAGIDINLVNADSLYKQNLSYLNIYPEMQYSIKWLKNWGFDLYLQYMWQVLTTNNPFANTGAEHIVTVQPTLYYFPLSNESNKIYLRLNYFNNISSTKYNFSQFQFGWKTSLFNQKKS